MHKLELREVTETLAVADGGWFLKAGPGAVRAPELKAQNFRTQHAAPGLKPLSYVANCGLAFASIGNFPSSAMVTERSERLAPCYASTTRPNPRYASRTAWRRSKQSANGRKVARTTPCHRVTTRPSETHHAPAATPTSSGKLTQYGIGKPSVCLGANRRVPNAERSWVVPEEWPPTRQA